MKRPLLLSLIAVAALIAAMVPGVAYADPPGNDDITTPVEISGQTGGPESGTTVDATASSTDPFNHPDWMGSHTDDLYGRSIWYEWTAPEAPSETSFYVANAANPVTGHYVAVGVYEIVDGALSEVAYNGWAPVDAEWARARVDIVPAANAVYYVGIGTRDAGAAVTLSWGVTPEPAGNDDFATAPALPVWGSGSTVDAHYEEGEPAGHDYGSDLGGRSVWYTYEPTESADISIGLEGSYDAVLGVYTGSLGSLTEVAFDWGDSSLVSFSAEAGVTYHVGIGGVGGYYVDNSQVVEWGDSGSYQIASGTAPDAPTGLVAQSGDGEVLLTWQPPSGGPPLTGYQIQYKLTSWWYWNDATPDPPPGGEATSVTIGSLDNDNTYEFRIRAANLLGWSDFSGTASAIPAGVPQIGITAATPGNGNVHLYWSVWDNGSAITSVNYTVAYNEQGATDDWTTVEVPLVRDIYGDATISGLANGTTYEFKVGVTNGVGTGWTTPVARMPYNTLVTITSITRIKGMTHVAFGSTGTPSASAFRCRLNTMTDWTDPCTSPYIVKPKGAKTVLVEGYVPGAGLWRTTETPLR